MRIVHWLEGLEQGRCNFNFSYRLRVAGVCYSVLREGELLLWASAAAAIFKLREKVSWAAKKEAAAFFIRCPAKKTRGKEKGKNMVRCHEVGGSALTVCVLYRPLGPLPSLSRGVLTFSPFIQHSQWGTAGAI